MNSNKLDNKKIVRILLRVSSNQQLEADGDLNVQRRLILDYVESHKEWILDKKEYFEGSNSGYKNSVADREVLQTALQDAKNKEYDILVAYKDDRIGRRMWEVGAYVMSLKNFGVDVYTAKDGCISPESDDLMGQVMLNFRYAMAQKSSMDTGMRVKDTAQKLVQKGKFMGGKAPYGYKLELSGNISKHGRALKHLVIMPEQAEVVKYIYDLSINKEYGSSKIAKVLNMDDKYKNMAPNDVWKSGTITSILTNPVYTGYTAYKRRERINGKYHSLDSKDWIVAEKQNKEIMIIDKELWNKVQVKRKQRSDKYIRKQENKNMIIIRRNDGELSLVDVLHCGYCGCKMVNGSKYNYWTIKSTGEKRTSKIPIYKCQYAWQGVPHEKTKQYRADIIEPIIFNVLAEYIVKIQENEDILELISKNQQKERKRLEMELNKAQKKLKEIRKDMNVLKSEIPKALRGKSEISMEYLSESLNANKEIELKQLNLIESIELEIKNILVTTEDLKEIYSRIPSWRDVFMSADSAEKRVLVNKLIERIDIKKDVVTVRFKINLNDFFLQPRMSINNVVQKQRLRFYNYIFHSL